MRNGGIGALFGNLNTNLRPRAIMGPGNSMTHQARELSPEQRRREVAAELVKLFAKVDSNRQPTTFDEAEEVFTEAMRSSRPGYRTQK
jgi:hypothetical protein